MNSSMAAIGNTANMLDAEQLPPSRRQKTISMMIEECQNTYCEVLIEDFRKQTHPNKDQSHANTLVQERDSDKEHEISAPFSVKRSFVKKKVVEENKPSTTVESERTPHDLRFLDGHVSDTVSCVYKNACSPKIASKRAQKPSTPATRQLRSANEERIITETRSSGQKNVRFKRKHRYVETKRSVIPAYVFKKASRALHPPPKTFEVHINQLGQKYIDEQLRLSKEQPHSSVRLSTVPADVLYLMQKVLDRTITRQHEISYVNNKDSSADSNKDIAVAVDGKEETDQSNGDGASCGHRPPAICA